MFQANLNSITPRPDRLPKTATCKYRALGLVQGLNAVRLQCAVLLFCGVAMNLKCHDCEPLSTLALDQNEICR
jgi:hypothetical protein